MPIKLNSSGGGSVTIDVPSTGSTFTATLPAQTGTVITSAGSAVVTPTMLSQPLTYMTVNAGGTTPFPAAAGPTVVDFTGIPSWANRITVMFQDVSTSSTSVMLVRLGTSGGIVSSGYSGASFTTVNAAVPLVATLSSGFSISGDSGAGYLRNGTLTLTRLTGNTWVGAGTGGNGDTARVWFVGGSIALASTLTQLRITTVNGTDLFDGGSINVFYEG